MPGKYRSTSNKEKVRLIAAINCMNKECVERKIKTLVSFLSPHEEQWIHIDVTDGKFSKTKLWNNPGELKEIKSHLPAWLRVEVHLMVQYPEKKAETWWRNGADRIIVHEEAIRDKASFQKRVKENADQLRIAVGPKVSVDEVLKYIGKIKHVQLLAVNPGEAGQKFQRVIIEKIKMIRSRSQNTDIEVDGGMNPRNVKKVIQAGATSIVAASYIFSSQNVKRAYQRLMTAINSG